MSEHPQYRFNRWWKGKLIENLNREVKRVKEVKFYGPPSGVYGCAWFFFEDGTSEPVPQGSHAFLPRKYDVKVIDEVSKE